MGPSQPVFVEEDNSPSNPKQAFWICYNLRPKDTQNNADYKARVSVNWLGSNQAANQYRVYHLGKQTVRLMYLRQNCFAVLAIGNPVWDTICIRQIQVPTGNRTSQGFQTGNSVCFGPDQRFAGCAGGERLRRIVRRI